jgi:hypothetical protein
MIRQAISPRFAINTVGTPTLRYSFARLWRINAGAGKCQQTLLHDFRSLLRQTVCAFHTIVTQ